MSDKLSVTLAYPYTDGEGKNHKADTTLALPRGEAVELLTYGKARSADEKKKEA
jgi:hypothetical protein